jgi:cytochrome c556
MNLIKINCSELNNTIRKKIESFIYDCLKSILNTNILLKSKNLGEGCEKILNDLKSSVNTVKALYELENKAETNRTETIPQLLNDYEDFLDWVFFYLSYDTYKVLEQAKDNVNSFEQSIKACHDSFIQIEMSMKSLTEVLENQKKKFTAELDEERAKLMEDITKLKAEVDEDREEIKNKIYGDDSTKFLDEIEKKNEWALTCQARLKEVVEKEGYLGNAFTTEDERVEQCLNDLAPMIKYFTFINKYKIVYKKEREDLLWQINFEDLDEFYNQYDLSIFQCIRYQHSKKESIKLN